MYPPSTQGNSGSYPSELRDARIGSSGAGNGLNALARVQIPQLLDEHAGQMHELRGVIHELEKRLSSVLAHDVPTATGAVPKDIDNNPQIADRILRSTLDVVSAASHVRDLIQRLQL